MEGTIFLIILVVVSAVDAASIAKENISHNNLEVVFEGSQPSRESKVYKRNKRESSVSQPTAEIYESEVVSKNSPAYQRRLMFSISKAKRSENMVVEGLGLFANRGRLEL